MTGASAQVIIDNGVIQLGINPAGNLITGGIGLTYLPTGGEALAPGCPCEAWGLADFANPATGFGIGQNTGDTSAPGVTHTENIVASGVGTDPASTGSSAVSTTDISVGGNPFAQVIHAFAPSSSPNLYEASVTITNTGAASITDLRYRRAMDWDVPPTEFSEFVTLQGYPATNLLASSDNGFADGNPFVPQGAIDPTTVNTNFEQSGPNDHGAVFDFGFGSLAVGANRDFSIFYGAAGNIDDALAALTVVNAEVYTLGMPSDSPSSDHLLGTPNTFIFGFAGVGGVPIGGAVPVHVETVQVIRQLGALVIQQHMESIGMRMNGLVGGADSESTSATAALPEDEPIALFEGASERLKLFASGNYSFGDFDLEPDSSADFDIQGINAGADYTRVGSWGPINAVNFGLAAGYGQGSADQDSGAVSPVSVDTEAFNISAFAGADFLEGGYANAVLAYSFADFDHQRVLAADTFEGDTEADQFGALLRLGYDFAISEASTHSVTLGPFALAELVDGEIDGFSESSATAPATALTYLDVDYQDVRTQLGARAHFQRNTSWGSAALTVKGAWEHLADDDRNAIIATTGGGLGSLAAVDLEAAEFANVGARLSANFHDRVTLAGEYDGTFGIDDDFEQHSIIGRVRIGF